MREEPLIDRHAAVKKEILDKLGKVIGIEVVDKSGATVEKIYGRPQSVDYIPNEGGNDDPFESQSDFF